MYRIATHIPNKHDATCWYRAAGPLAVLRKLFQGFSFEPIQEWSFSSVLPYDCAFFQRPSTKSELEAIRICKRLNIPVIVDFDDLLFDLPPDNPAYRMYMNKETQETIISIIREADCVWVSTAELKRCLQIPGASLNKRVYVVNNALDDLHMVVGSKKEPLPIDRRQPTVLWRGSPTHERDVMEFTPEIAEAADGSPENKFLFLGYNPWFLTERMNPTQAILAPPVPVGEFMEFVHATAARIGIVPLHDSRFNRCKSNIAWLEMTWAGGVVLAPDWEEWRQPGVVTYKDEKDFLGALKLLLSMPKEQLAEMNAMSWNHIKENFVTSGVNKIRALTIEACIHKSIGVDTWPEGWQELPPADDSVMELE